MSLSMKQLYLQKVLTADAQQRTQTTKKDKRIFFKNAQRWKDFHKVEIISGFFLHKFQSGYATRVEID